MNRKIIKQKKNAYIIWGDSEGAKNMRLGKTQTQAIIMVLVLLGIYAIFYLIGYITYLIESFSTAGLTIVTFQMVLVYLIYDKVCQLNRHYHKNWPTITK